MSRSREVAPPSSRWICILLAQMQNTGGRKGSGSTTVCREATKAIAEASE